METHKLGGAGVKCEVAISVFSGGIVKICGPHRGSKHDWTTFRESLMCLLDEGEMAEADKGHVVEADRIRARDDCATGAERREKQRVRASHESCAHRFKCFGTLKQERSTTQRNIAGCFGPLQASVS